MYILCMHLSVKAVFIHQSGFVLFRSSRMMRFVLLWIAMHLCRHKYNVLTKRRLVMQLDSTERNIMVLCFVMLIVNWM